MNFFSILMYFNFIYIYMKERSSREEKGLKVTELSCKARRRSYEKSLSRKRSRTFYWVTSFRFPDFSDYFLLFPLSSYRPKVLYSIFVPIK